ncbi:21546_t:CDS:2, partial [Cetraspora pellucida]
LLSISGKISCDLPWSPAFQSFDDSDEISCGLLAFMVFRQFSGEISCGLSGLSSISGEISCDLPWSSGFL